MAKKFILMGILVLSLVFTMTVIACGGGDDTPVIFPVNPPEGGGNTGGAGGGDGGNSGGAGGGGGNSGGKVDTPITQIPDNYLNTTWRIPGDIYIRIGSDASKFVFDQVGNNVGNKTFDKLSSITKDQIATGYDSGLYAESYNSNGIICFMNDGSKLKWLGSTYTKQ